MSALETQTQAPVGWAGVRVDAECVAALGNRIPRPVARFEVYLVQRGVVFEHRRPDLVDQLLDAAGLERREHVPYDFSCSSRAATVIEGRGNTGVTPVEVEPHVERPVHQ